MYAVSGIQTRDPSNQAAVDLCLGPHGHRDGHGLYLINIIRTLHYNDFKFCYSRFSLVIHTAEDKTTHVVLECTKKHSSRLRYIYTANTRTLTSR